MALVTPSDLRTYMDITFTNRQIDAAEIVLAGLQSEMEMYLRRPVESTSYTEIHRIESTHSGIPMSSFFVNSNPTGESFYDSQINNSTYLEPPTTVYLRNTPVVSISLVRHKPLGGAETTLVADQDYVMRSYGLDIPYIYADDTVTVTYQGGLNGQSIPGFKLLILRAATREMQNMHDDVVGVKDLETRNVAPLQTGFLETELMTLKRYRKNRIS